MRSSAFVVPSAAKRARASADGSKLSSYVSSVSGWQVISQKGTHMDSCKKRRTLYMVMRDVGDDDIMIIGNMFSIRIVSEITKRISGNPTHFASVPVPLGLQVR